MNIDTTVHLNDIISFVIAPFIAWLIHKVTDIDKKLAVVETLITIFSDRIKSEE